MPKPKFKPKSKLQLRFTHHRALDHLDDPVEHDLSAAARWGNCLFVSCDEGAGVDRLTEGEGEWGSHVHFALGEILDLPAGPKGEMDVEGLDCADGWLWVVGSHSLKRKKPKEGQPPLEALERMATVESEPNRYFLGRFPLVRDEGGFAPVAEDGERRVQHVRFGGGRSRLSNWLKDDAHLGRFLGVPSKENGLDIEGIAVRGLRVWLGLRGPVLRGWAVILELEFKVTASGHLKAQRIDGDRRYRKHLLQAGGLGVRDLALHGDDLLVMTGSTMVGGGPAHVLRWKDAVGCRTGGVHGREAVEVVLDLPDHGAYDHAEGLVPWGEDWLVVYDSPTERRLEGEGAVVAADIWEIR